SIFNTQVLVNTKPFITYSQWAHTILGSIIIGTIFCYGKYYPLLSQMHYIFAIALAIIGVTVIKIMQSYC
ncbi:DNA internalization-related competence protein ComEC/Rec2, partial [human gut metagenome]